MIIGDALGHPSYQHRLVVQRCIGDFHQDFPGIQRWAKLVRGQKLTSFAILLSLPVAPKPAQRAAALILTAKLIVFQRKEAPVNDIGQFEPYAGIDGGFRIGKSDRTALMPATRRVGEHQRGAFAGNSTMIPQLPARDRSPRRR